MSHSAIRQAIVEMNEEALDEEQLLQLTKFMPTREELSMIQDYLDNDGQASLLSKTCTFFQKIYTIASVFFDNITLVLHKKLKKSDVNL